MDGHRARSLSAAIDGAGPWRTFTSVVWRPSVRECSALPITRLNLLIAVSTRARFMYPDAFCQAMRPRSAMSWRWRSRWVGSLSAVLLGTAVARGGTMMAASGWRSAILA